MNSTFLRLVSWMRSRTFFDIGLSTLSSAGLGVLLLPGGTLSGADLPISLRLLSGAGDQAQGQLLQTGIANDLAIEGKGMFLVREPHSGQRQLTRAGMFLVDRDGYLITLDRWRVQGWSDSASAIQGDVQVDGSQRPAPADPQAVVANYRFDPAGRVRVRLTDGTEFVRGQVGRYVVPIGLISDPAGYGRYLVDNQALSMFPPSEWLRSGALEDLPLTARLLTIRQRLHYEIQGFLQRTGDPADLALSGSGWLVMRDPVAGTTAVTRSLHVSRDAAGHLVDDRGRRLQGANDAAGSVLGDIVVDGVGRPATADPSAGIVGFSIHRDGQIYAELSDGSEFPRSQVLLSRFREAFKLRPLGEGMYGNLDEAVPDGFFPPGRNGNGVIESGARELPASLPELVLSHGPGVRLLLSGPSGGRVTLEAANELGTWTPLSEFELADGLFEYFDSLSTGPLSRRFYRIGGTSGSNQ